MLFAVQTTKPIEQVDKALREAAGRYHFGVLAVHDLEQVLKEKGQPIAWACRVYEVCNPQQAKTVLEHRPALSSMLPCRISVYQDGEALTISTILPKGLAQLIPGKDIDEILDDIETSMKAVVKEAAG
jgi:uncharacterized protein (DUF302 family)